MRIGRRRRPSPAARLAAAAGLQDALSSSNTAVTRDVAFLVMRPGSFAIQPVLAEVEALLAEEMTYDVALGFLEEVQNVVSHGLSEFLAPSDVVPLLGPRAVVCWTSLTTFWVEVARWCAENGPPLESSEQILSVENEQLRTQLWTSNRTTIGGHKLGLAHAVGYERATGVGLPGYSHVAAVLGSAAEGGPGRR